MDETIISAIMAALSQGQRVELTMQKDGSIKARTVWRKDIKMT